MTNKIQDNEVIAASPPCCPSRGVPVHVLTKRKKNERKWNLNAQKFNKTKTTYVVRLCSNCSKTTWSYWPCDSGQDLCGVCFGKHLQDHEGWNSEGINCAPAELVLSPRCKFVAHFRQNFGATPALGIIPPVHWLRCVTCLYHVFGQECWWGCW